jgi:hypothetical protein
LKSLFLGEAMSRSCTRIEGCPEDRSINTCLSWLLVEDFY